MTCTARPTGASSSAWSSTFFDTIIRIPAMVILRARTITVRLIGYTVSLARLFSAWRFTERPRFG